MDDEHVSEQNIDNEKELNKYTTILEKIMVTLDSTIPEKCRRFYLAGVIDCWEDTGQISEETRGNLYVAYCF